MIWESLIAATQAMFAVWEGVLTRAMWMCFSLICEVVSGFQFEALGALGGGGGVKHGVMRV